MPVFSRHAASVQNYRAGEIVNAIGSFGQSLQTFLPHDDKPARRNRSAALMRKAECSPFLDSNKQSWEAIV
jgi:hypothetical protein